MQSPQVMSQPSIFAFYSGHVSFAGIAEWCYEGIAKRLEGSFRPSRNHIVIQQRRLFPSLQIKTAIAIALRHIDESHLQGKSAQKDLISVPIA